MLGTQARGHLAISVSGFIPILDLPSFRPRFNENCGVRYKVLVKPYIGANAVTDCAAVPDFRAFEHPACPGFIMATMNRSPDNRILSINV